MSAFGVTFVRRAGSLRFVDLRTLLETTTNAMDCTLARLRFRRKRAVTASVSLLAQTSTVVAVPVLRAVIQACTDVTCIARPARVAVTHHIHAFAISTATLTIAWATPFTVSTTPTVVARAHAVKALAVAVAAVAWLVLMARWVAVSLAAVIASVLRVADAPHLITNSHAVAIA